MYSERLEPGQLLTTFKGLPDHLIGYKVQLFEKSKTLQCIYYVTIFKSSSLT